MENRTTAACGPVSLPRVDAPPRPCAAAGHAQLLAIYRLRWALCAPGRATPRSGKDERLASHRGELRRPLEFILIVILWYFL